MTWKKWLKKVVIVSAVINFGCANLFEEMSDKNTDDALLFAAKIKADAYNWTGAIADIAKTSAAFQARRDVQVFLSTLYAGRCGLDIIDLADRLQNAGTSSLFGILLTAFRGKVQAHLDDCRQAESILTTIGATASVRTTEENILMIFVTLSKMGVVLNIRADADADGVLDTGFTPCNSNAATGNADMPASDNVTKADLTELVTGLAVLFDSLTTSFTSGLGGIGTTITNTCNTLAATLGAASLCTKYTRASVTVGMDTLALRALVVENSGFGLAVNDTTMCNFTSANPCRCSAANCFTGSGGDNFCFGYAQ